MADNVLLHAEQQMLMSRPWHAAEEGSVWQVTAEQGNHRWDRCIAMAVREPTALDPPEPCWFMDGFTIGGGLDRMIHPDSILSATPLLLVHRDYPSRAVDERDQFWIDRSGESR